MINSKTLWLLGIGLSLFLACKNNAQKPFGKDPALEGARWTLVEMKGVAISLPAGSQEIYLNFEGQSNTFGGHAGCNQCNGMYTTQDDMIKLQTMAVTKMACPALEQESDFLKALEEVNRYELKSKKENKITVRYLFLFKDEQLLAKLKAGPLK
ncbi:MAG: META domain-containing protein [Bacteroidia bacterium]|nr:META domain-containing protein [Bacteroidia bacterium]